MNTRRHLRSRLSALAGMVAVGLAIPFAAPPAQAQQVTTLIQFTNVWKYDQTGANLGREWRSNTFSDAAWPEGRAAFGYEPDAASIANYNTSMGITPTISPFNTPFPQLTTVTTYYFRTTFNFAGSVAGLSLIASNLLDDGMVIHLNGAEVGRLRTPLNQTATTQPSAGSPAEGVIEPMVLSNPGAAIRDGENLLTVEVHNSTFGTYDMAFGMKLMAFQPTPLVIADQPQSQIVIVGDPVTLRVGVIGGPVSYRWKKDGAFLSSTSNSLVIASAQPANAGRYQAVCSNALTVVTSSVATLTVLPDLIGPTVVSAIADNRLPTIGSFGLHTINIQFSEMMNNTSVRNTNNYTITRLGTTNTVTITNALYSSALGLLLRLDVNDPNWIPYADYIVTINNVTDIKGNAIAPNTTVPVSWLVPTNLVSAATAWSSHARYFLDQGIYNQPWNTVAYVEDPQFWVTGAGPFCGGAIPAPPCFMDCETPIDYQLSPTLFRTTFTRPAELGATAPLVLSGSVDDGAVVFLNGVEVWRVNALGSSPNITVTNYADLSRVGAYCFTNITITVTNFLPGNNCLAVAVLQSRVASEFDTAFFLTADAIMNIAPVLLPDPAPVLTITPLEDDAARLAWIGGGFLLEASTNLNFGDMSYPYGPWTQVANMSNPYTNRPAGTPRFFRLKR